MAFSTSKPHKITIYARSKTNLFGNWTLESSDAANCEFQAPFLGLSIDKVPIFDKYMSDITNDSLFAAMQVNSSIKNPQVMVVTSENLIDFKNTKTLKFIFNRDNYNRKLNKFSKSIVLNLLDESNKVVATWNPTGKNCFCERGEIDISNISKARFQIVMTAKINLDLAYILTKGGEYVKTKFNEFVIGSALMTFRDLGFVEYGLSFEISDMWTE